MLTADMVWQGCWICTDRFQTENCLYLCSPPGSYGTYYWVWSLNSRLNELTVVSRGCWRPVWSGVQAWFFFPTLLLLLLAPSSPLLSLLYFSSPSSSSFPFPLYCCLSYLLYLSFPLLLFHPFSFCTDTHFLLPLPVVWQTFSGERWSNVSSLQTGNQRQSEVQIPPESNLVNQSFHRYHFQEYRWEAFRDPKMSQIKLHHQRTPQHWGQLTEVGKPGISAHSSGSLEGPFHWL